MSEADCLGNELSQYTTFPWQPRISRIERTCCPEENFERIRDVFGAYQMLSTLDLDSKPGLGFVIKHLAKVCDDEPEEPRNTFENNKDWEKIRTVYNAYKKLAKWVPEEAEKVLVEHLEAILGLTDSSTTQQQTSEPFQVKTEKTEEVDEEDTELVNNLEQSPSRVSTMATNPGSSSSSLPCLSTVKSENNCDMDIDLQLLRKFNITQDVKITITKIPLEDLCLKKRGPYKKRVKNQSLSTYQTNKSPRFVRIHKEVVTTYSVGCRKPGSMNLLFTNQMPVNSCNRRDESDNKVSYHSQCDKGRSNQSVLRKSVPYHLLPKSFVCKHCKKSFKTQNEVTLHKRIHTGYKPYHCKYCQKFFTTSSHLRTHERIHTGERPYSCKYCPKSFSQRSSVTLHERRHTGEKNYKCRHCQMAFVCYSEMRLHEKIHDSTREYKFEYKFCLKKFLHKDSHRDHEKYFVCRKGMPKLSKF